MGEIDVTKVTAIEYLEKLIKIDSERHRVSTLMR